MRLGRLSTHSNQLARRIMMTAAAVLFTHAVATPLVMGAGTVLTHDRGTAVGSDHLEEMIDRVAETSRLHALIVAHEGSPMIERVFDGHRLDEATNVKSVAKIVIAALVGAAIARDEIEGVNQRISPILADRVPEDADPRIHEITIDHLLSMRAGLKRTSGPNYGHWVASSDWVRFVLSQPFVDEPGGRTLYSTGNSHLLSAILTRATGRSTLQLAREWLGEPLGISVPAWDRDPQGIYFGGNNMVLSPRALLRIGELYRQGGVIDGERILPESWVRDSWQPRGRSEHTRHLYGHGWSITEMRGHTVYYAWGFGGQMLHVVPTLALTIVITSDPTDPSRVTGYVEELHELVGDGVIPAVELVADRAAHY